MRAQGADKIRENRLRRMARRQRAELVKSRRRDPLAWDYGRYWLLVPGGRVVGGSRLLGSPPGLTLDQVEAWLTQDHDQKETDGPR